MFFVKYYLATILALMLFGVPAVNSRFSGEVDYFAKIFSNITDQFAAVILSHNPKTVAYIKEKYSRPIVQLASVNNIVNENKVRVLIVPGHEPTYGGAEYKDLKERDMVVELSNDLKRLLENNGHYQVFITRDEKEWNPEFSSYFKNHWNDIIEWQRASAKDMARRISTGSSTKPVSLVYHNKVPSDVAFRLYGINKWINDNNIDITIHIHFNDDPERRSNRPGKYSGFSIYIPEHQYSNGTTSKAIAKDVFNRLAEYNPISTLKGEANGVVEEPDLIAVGAHDTVDAASMLIEYGYIYESSFSATTTRSQAFNNLAYETYLGLEDFFNSKSE